MFTMHDNEKTQHLLNLLDIVQTLRSPEGCPWDKKQTPESLKPYILEETYEVLEAIDRGDSHDICDELGDLLLQIVFIAQMFSEQGDFGFYEIADSIAKKMVRRHPHIFEDSDTEPHTQQWENIKKHEREKQGKSHKLAERIPPALPALKRATKLAKVIEPQQPEILLKQIEETTAALSHQFTKNRDTALDESVAELLFSVVQFSQQIKLDAEDLLRKKITQVINEIEAE